MDKTANLSLPLIMPSQAQKHVTHNEALTVLDALVHLSVRSRTRSTPPVSPDEGERHIVDTPAQGDWQGWDHALAHYVGGGWDRLVPKAGWHAWVDDEAMLYVFDGAVWTPFGQSADGRFDMLGIHASADTVNRLTVASPATLLTHDGTGHQLKINKAASGDTASLLFQTAFSGRAEMGTTGSDAFGIKVSTDGAGWTDALNDPDDPDSEQGLRYEQFVPILIRAVQELSAEIERIREAG